MCHLLCGTGNGEGTTINIPVAHRQIVIIKCGKRSARRGYKIHERIEEEPAGDEGGFGDGIGAAS